MKHTRWILFAGLAGLLLGVGFGVLAWINHPMGQTLALHTPTPGITPAAAEPISTQTSFPVGKTPTVVVAMPASTRTIPPAEVAKICGNTGSMRLLVIGLTTPTGEELLGADAIRLVTINFDQPFATIMTLPVLLWVDTPTLADLGVAEIELSLVYPKAYSAAKSDPERVRARKATQVLAQTIVDNFGYEPDHYITVNEDAFVKYVDALGGIEIDLPKAVDGTSEGYGIYSAGPQLLDGTRTLNITRLFHPGGLNDLDIWGNMVRQNLVVRGILAATLKPQNWTKIPSLMHEVHQAVVTDLSLNQTLDLACMAGEVGEKARISVVGEEMVKLDGLGRMIPDVEAIKHLIAEMGSSD